MRVLQASHHALQFRLTNTTDRRLEVAKIVTSCECLVIQPRDFAVGPAETIEASAVLDFTKQPDFTGGLPLEAQGFSAAGQDLFKLVIEVTVDPRNLDDPAVSTSTENAESEGHVPLPVPMVPISSAGGAKANVR